MTSRLDEDDVRVRPRRRTRPRSKVRPSHADAVPAVVEGIDRGRYQCRLMDASGDDSRPAPDSGADTRAGAVVAMKARALGHIRIVVGDEVRLTGDTSGAPGTLARIVELLPRRTLLLRTADDSTPVERPLVANADQLGIVVAAAEPEPRQGFVDRCLVASYDAGILPLLIVTKTDLADPRDFLSAYVDLEVPWVPVRPGTAAETLRPLLADQCTVLVGHSGVGKSTLVNALLPAAERATGVVNAVTGRGRHTSTSAVMLALPGGGSIIDTPGVRSFGLHHVDPDTVVGAFGDLAVGLDDCPRGCSHDEPDCGLDAFVAAGGAPPQRLASLRRILRTLAEAPEAWE